jgi:DNA transformation protein
MSYWRVPIEVLEDSGELAAWALAAIRAAGNAASKPKRKPAAKRKPAPKRRPKRGEGSRGGRKKAR